MKRLVNVLLLILVIIEVVVFLLPTTFLYISGRIFLLVISLEMLFSAAGERFAIQFFVMSFALLLLPGYGIYSLWWLVIHYRKVSLSEIPRFVWGGLVVGGIIVFIIVFEYVKAELRSQHQSVLESAMDIIILGGGPLMLTLTLLAIMLPRKRL